MLNLIPFHDFRQALVHPCHSTWEFSVWEELIHRVPAVGFGCGTGRSQILGDRVLCVQAVCSKVTGALSWEGGMSFLCVCACVYVCQRDRDRETEVWEEGEIPFLLPGPLPGQNEVHWFSPRQTITWTACG